MSLLKIVFICFAAWLLSCLVGCSSSKMNIPNFYNNLPSDTNYVYVTKSASSVNFVMAKEKVNMEAMTEFACLVQSKISELKLNAGIVKPVNDSIKIATSPNKVSRDCNATILTDLSVVKQKNLLDHNVYTVFVLYKYPIGAFDSDVVSTIKNDDSLFTQVKGGAAFKELEKKVDAYKLFKENLRQDQI